MREKPILFSAPMVQAILDGRKSMTRRVCKDIADYNFKWSLDREPYIGNYKVFTKTEPGKWGWVTLENQWLYDLQTTVDDSRTYLLKCPCQPGDLLWVRETWWRNYSHEYGRYWYRADGEEIEIPTINGETMIYGKADGLKWRPSIHMPKTAARIWLEVVNVRVERLQEITKEDARAEGVGNLFIEDCAYDEKYEDIPWNQEEGLAIHQFARLWNSTIKKQDLPMCGWDTNPFCWVIEFRRVAK